MILIDTNVFSELTKPQPEPRVSDWLFEHRDETLLSTIVIAELSVGIRTTRGERKRALLRPWLERLVEAHVDRVVPFDLVSAQKWGEFAADVLLSDRRIGSRQFDTMLAAQALALDVPLATRNVRDFEGSGVRVIDPWRA